MPTWEMGRCDVSVAPDSSLDLCWGLQEAQVKMSPFYLTLASLFFFFPLTKVMPISIPIEVIFGRELIYI